MLFCGMLNILLMVVLVSSLSVRALFCIVILVLSVVFVVSGVVFIMMISFLRADKSSESGRRPAWAKGLGLLASSPTASLV